MSEQSFKGDLHREDTTPAEEPKAETSCPSSLSGVVLWSAVARGIFPSSEDLHALNYASEQSRLTARKFPLHFLHGTLQSSGSAKSCKGTYSYSHLYFVQPPGLSQAVYYFQAGDLVSDLA